MHRSHFENLQEVGNSDNVEFERSLAKNPSTPAEKLEQLSHSCDAITRQYVTANPNTPTNILLKLGAEFPEQLIDNHVLPLLFLKNPEL